MQFGLGGLSQGWRQAERDTRAQERWDQQSQLNEMQLQQAQAKEALRKRIQDGIDSGAIPALKRMKQQYYQTGQINEDDALTALRGSKYDDSIVKPDSRNEGLVFWSQDGEHGYRFDNPEEMIAKLEATYMDPKTVLEEMSSLFQAWEGDTHTYVTQDESGRPVTAEMTPAQALRDKRQSGRQWMKLENYQTLQELQPDPQYMVNVNGQQLPFDMLPSEAKNAVLGFGGGADRSDAVPYSMRLDDGTTHIIDVIPGSEEEWLVREAGFTRGTFKGGPDRGDEVSPDKFFRDMVEKIQENDQFNRLSPDEVVQKARKMTDLVFSQFQGQNAGGGQRLGVQSAQQPLMPDTQGQFGLSLFSGMNQRQDSQSPVRQPISREQAPEIVNQYRGKNSGRLVYELADGSKVYADELRANLGR